MVDFLSRYSSYSNIELLKILDAQNDYLPEAIAAASKVLTERNLGFDEMNAIKEDINREKTIKEEIEMHRKAVSEDIKSKIVNFGELLNPISKENPSSNRIIYFIGLVMSIIFLHLVYQEWGMIGFMFSSPSAKWDISMIIYFLPLIWLPIAIALFITKRKIGWLLLATFVGYTLINWGYSLYFFLKWPIVDAYTIDFIFPKSSPIGFVSNFLIYAGILYTLSKGDIRKVFNVSIKSVFAIVVIIVCSSIYLIFFNT